MKNLFLMSDKNNPKSVEASQALSRRYRAQIKKRVQQADVAVVLGGDGFLLRSLQRLMDKNIPVFGLNLGHKGALLNPFDIENLNSRIDNAKANILFPLEAACMYGSNRTKTKTVYAFNEIAFKASNTQMVHLNVETCDFSNEEPVITTHQVWGDGIMVATPAGSTSYYCNAGGQPFGFTSGKLGIQSICAPKEYCFNQLLPDTTHITVSVNDTFKRPACIRADNGTLSHVQKCRIQMSKRYPISLLFDQQRQGRS